jgi:hypothetical protein
MRGRRFSSTYMHSAGQRRISLELEGFFWGPILLLCYSLNFLTDRGRARHRRSTNQLSTAPASASIVPCRGFAPHRFGSSCFLSLVPFTQVNRRLRPSPYQPVGASLVNTNQGRDGYLRKLQEESNTKAKTASGN